MKKIGKILWALFILALCLPCGAYAKTEESDELGISFNIADEWEAMHDSGALKYGRNDTNEFVHVEKIASDMPYSFDDLGESDWTSLAELIFANDEIAERISVTNDGTPVTVSEISKATSYEEHNATKYFKYEKLYTAHSDSDAFLDTTFHSSAYLTLKGGNLYIIIYIREVDYNNSSEVVAMLDSIQYTGVVKIEINGEKIYPDSEPVIIEGRTLVPIRAVAEKLGYTVDWDPEYMLITMLSEDEETILHFVIGESYALKNLEEEIPLDVPATIIGSRTYLPLRAVAEAMDAEVSWNAAERTVEISK